ncbi:Suppressor of the cold-sensitive snRNP biogenesis mutant brr1-1 [Orbilia blumenaviensis]|uniref:Suppressor of the cold-sensitive snRNP biogenesis mutant brr1-1 n=1 Tax=Orbilia blumenaviensis TaxID=1796055 RepID=A0AAV9UP55_9PEZI
MRHPNNFLLFLTLLLSRLSLIVAEPFIFMINNDNAKPGNGVAELHASLAAIDAEPPWNWLAPANTRYGTLFKGPVFLVCNTTKPKAADVVKKHPHMIFEWTSYGAHREPLYTAFESPGFTIDHNINQRQERLMMAQSQGDEKISKYYHHNSQGEGVTVYIVDTGINRDHPEFMDLVEEDRLEVLFAEPFPPLPAFRKIDIDSSLRFSHGSSVAGVIAGKVTGLAPKANIVMIAALDRDGMSSEALYVDALVKLYNHITQYNADKTVIVNLSLSAGYFLPMGEDKVKTALRGVLNFVFDELMKLPNVLVTAASGVSEWGEDNVSFSWPVRRAEDFTNNQRLIVVGGVDPEGNGIFQKPHPNYQAVYAPAYAVKIASNIGYQLTTGTSYASAFAAATLANYLSRNRRLTADGARDLLLKNSYPRISTGPPVIWAGITQLEAGITPEDMLCRRDGDGANCKPRSQKPSNSGDKTQSNPKPPVQTSGPPGKQDSGGYPTPVDDDFDDVDPYDEEDADVVTTTVLKELQYEVTKTVMRGGSKPTSVAQPSVDPLADPLDRNRDPLEARSAAPTTQPAKIFQNSSVLTLKTSTTIQEPPSKA